MQAQALPIIFVKHLTKQYGIQKAADNVSFSINAGEVIGFVGLNGAGKSTTINLILGFLRASSGSIEVLGHTIKPETAHQVHDKIGFASGDMSLFEHLTGDQYLRFVSNRFKLKNHDRRTELERQFHPQLDKPIGDLSRGNKQKIALIAAFLARPKLVILDEPSSGLDPFMQESFLDLIRQEQAAGTTIFMSSHYLNEVAQVCSRILFMREGKLVKDIDAYELEQASGKLVSVISEALLHSPKGAENIQTTKNQHHELTFVFKGDPKTLLSWLAMQKRVIDFSVSEHDLQAEFAHLVEPSKDAKS